MRAGAMGKLMSIDTRGKFGYSGGFARIKFGYNRLGFYDWLCGIYTKQWYYGKWHISRKQFYRPTDPMSVAQLARRAVMRDGMIAWAGEPTPVKDDYKKRAARLRMHGHNLYMREYLNTH